MQRPWLSKKFGRPRPSRNFGDETKEPRIDITSCTLCGLVLGTFRFLHIGIVVLRAEEVVPHVDPNNDSSVFFLKLRNAHSLRQVFRHLVFPGLVARVCAFKADVFIVSRIALLEGESHDVRTSTKQWLSNEVVAAVLPSGWSPC